MSDLIKCHFTREELEYINAVMCREQVLSAYVDKHFKGLETIGVQMTYLKQPNILGKLLSYLKKAGEVRDDG